MLTLYHGTDKTSGTKIISSKSFKRSLGEEHWLGDGVYFYEEKYYAFRWIYIAYIKKYPQHVPEMENITTKYTILSADIKTVPERIFDLAKIEHKLIFDRVYKKSLEKNKNRNLKIVDGAVFNFLFYKMGYKKEYDLIKALFIHEDNDIQINHTRLSYIPEVQYCVINAEVIKNIKNSSILNEDMFSFAQHYNESGNGRLIKYKPRKNSYKN